MQEVQKLCVAGNEKDKGKNKRHDKSTVDGRIEMQSLHEITRDELRNISSAMDLENRVNEQRMSDNVTESTIFQNNWETDGTIKDCNINTVCV